jgi:DNA polymerase III delta prime subunit
MATPVPSKAPQAPAPRPAAAATPPKAPASLPSRLGQIEKKRLTLGLRFMFYGPPGVGKTTLAADANALFADVEGGSGELEVARYPFNPGQPDEYKPRNYDQLNDCLDDLIAHPGHGFGAFAVDTASALEALIHRHLCEKYKVNSIEKVGGGYGKGYRAAVEELRRLLAKLDVLRAQGVQIIILGHSVVTTFKNPEGEDFDRYSLAAHKEFAGQLTEWCDVVGFLHFEGGSKKIEEDGSRDKRARGWASNRRLMQLAREAAWDAKCRLSVPSEFELDTDHPWHPFATAARGSRLTDTASLIESIKTELNRIGLDTFMSASGAPVHRQAVLDKIQTADIDTLTRIHAGLASTPATNKEI